MIEPILTSVIVLAIVGLIFTVDYRSRTASDKRFETVFKSLDRHKEYDNETYMKKETCIEKEKSFFLAIGNMAKDIAEIKLAIRDICNKVEEKFKNA